MFKIPQDTHNKRKRIHWFIVSITALATILLFYWLALRVVEGEEDISSLATVNRGDFKVAIDVFGSLQAKKRRSILSRNSGVVEQINFLPGDKVDSKDIIIVIANQQLERELQNSQLSVLEAEATIEKIKAEQSQQLSALQLKIKIAQGNLLLTENHLNAIKKLNAKNIISNQDLEKAKLNYAQAKLTLLSDQSQLKTIDKTNTSIEKVGRLKLEREKKNFDFLTLLVNDLNVKASMNGIITVLDSSIEIGSKISEGFQLGQIANVDSLYADLRINAGDANLVNLEQSVVLQIGGVKVSGIVKRISPQVKEATIEIEVFITDTLPSAARPNINISGQVIIKNIPDTLFATRPSYIVSSGEYLIEVIDDKSNQVSKRNVLVGEVTRDKIQIISGLSENEKIILKQ